MKHRINLILFPFFFFCSCKSHESKKIYNDETLATPIIGYSVSAIYPHDTTSFTEGLLIHDGEMYESTGSPLELQQTKSLFGPVDLKTGKIRKKVELDKQYFGEGIVFLKNKVYQLTYQNKVGFIYDLETFKKLGTFSFPSKEGWGLTTDGVNLIMSDGSTTLTYLNPDSFNVLKTINVADENGPVQNINELEFINGYLYANVYTTNTIVKIDINTGNIVGKLDLSYLAREAKIKYPGSLEMNGIAYDSLLNKIYVTGKMWPNIYRIDFVH